MRHKPAHEALGLRFDRISATGRAALVLALVALWLLGRRYAGFTHDATLYVAQGLRRLDPASFDRDLFFAYGAQDDYTLFPRLYAPLIDLFGAGTAAMLVTIVGQLAFFAAAASLVFRMTPGMARWWSLALLAAISGYYGGVGTFRMAEPFATARTLAEPLVIAVLAGTLAGRPRMALAALAAAAVVHPLVAAPGIAVIFLWHAAQRPRLLWSLPLLAILAAGLAGASPVLTERFDSAWLAVVLERSPHLFLSQWQAPDWARVVWGLCSVWLGLRFVDMPVSRLLLSAAGAALAGIAITWLAADLLHGVLAAGLQLWRAHWLLQLLAIVMVPVAVAGLWPRASAARAAGVLLAASCCFGRAELPVSAVLAALAVLFDASERFWPGWMGTKLLRVALAAATGAASVGFLLDVQSRLPLVYGTTQPASWADYLPAVGSLGGLVPLASLLWLAACSRFHIVAVALAAAALLGSVAVWDARSPWQRFIEQADGQQNPFRHALAPQAQVFWSDPNGPVWLALGTATWFSVDQGAGVAFSRATAMEYDARKRASESLRGRIQNCALAHPAECRIDSRVAIALCRRPAGPDYLVLNGFIDGHRAAAQWRMPAAIGTRRPTLHLFSCRDLAGRNRE
jgi:hypothetical protein